MTGPGYGAAVRLMWETSRPLSFAVAGYAIAASVLPNLVLIAAGHLVGSIPAAAAGRAGALDLPDPLGGDEIRQGAEIGRPSVLYATVTGEGDRIDSVEVGGAALIVAEGRFRVTPA